MEYNACVSCALIGHNFPTVYKEPTSLPSLCVCVLFCYDIKTLYLYHITMYVPNLCEFTDFKNPLIILFSEITYPII